MKDLKITKGEYTRDKQDTIIYSPEGIEIWVYKFAGQKELAENMIAFLLDSIDTAQKCGILPSELLKQRDELREALKELMEGVKGLPPLTAIAGTLTRQYTKAEQALKNSER